MGASSDNDVLDGWPFTNRYQARERSILSEFFHSQEETFDEDDKLMEASTAASISSSTYKDVTVVADEEIEKMKHMLKSTLADIEKMEVKKPSLFTEIESKENVNSNIPQQEEKGDSYQTMNIVKKAANDKQNISNAVNN